MKIKSKEERITQIIAHVVMSGFTVILVKNYFQQNIPKELLEAAEIDGAGQYNIFFKIVMPLSTPILATIGLLNAVSYWNDWTNGLYYINNTKLYSIQQLLNEMNNNIQYLANNASNLQGANLGSLPSNTVRMAIAVMAILPIIIIYPFFQKYFARGITARACLEIAFCQMCVTVCGRFAPNEGGVAGYAD